MGDVTIVVTGAVKGSHLQPRYNATFDTEVYINFNLYTAKNTTLALCLGLARLKKNRLSITELFSFFA